MQNRLKEKLCKSLRTLSCIHSVCEIEASRMYSCEPDVKFTECEQANKRHTNKHTHTHTHTQRMPVPVAARFTA